MTMWEKQTFERAIEIKRENLDDHALSEITIILSKRLKTHNNNIQIED